MGTRSFRERPSGIAWLIEFLNLDFDRRNKRDKKKIDELLRNARSDPDTARRVQAQWWRYLAFFAEQRKLTDSVETGIRVLSGLIKTQEATIAQLSEEVKSITAVPEGTVFCRPEEGFYSVTPERAMTLAEWKEQRSDDLESLKDELDTLKDRKRKMTEFLGLTESEAIKRSVEIKKALAGACFLTREKALEEIVQKISVWGATVSFRWRCRPAAEAAKGYIKPGQAFLKVDDKKFVVDHFPVNNQLADRVSHIIANGLESGELARLRRCGLDECRQFFLTPHLGKWHCKPEHQKEHDKKEARERAKKWRTMMAKA
jgi:hypothetical protein